MGLPLAQGDLLPVRTTIEAAVTHLLVDPSNALRVVDVASFTDRKLLVRTLGIRAVLSMPFNPVHAFSRLVRPRFRWMVPVTRDTVR